MMKNDKGIQDRHAFRAAYAAQPPLLDVDRALVSEMLRHTPHPGRYYARATNRPSHD
jgi:hypothetical protein